VRFQPFTVPEQLNGLSRKPQLLGDRFEYWDDDANGQFYCVLPENDANPVRLTIRNKRGEIVGEHAASNAPHRKVHFLLRTAALKPGEYTVEAGAAKFSLARVARSRDTVRFPSNGVPLVLQAQSALRDVDWPVRVGVPLPPDAVASAEQLAVFENGKRIPAQITARATWSPDGPPKWVHVHFVGKYRNGKPAKYRLKRAAASVPPEGGTTNARAQSAMVEEDNERIVVDTGAVKFEVVRKGFAGIERAWLGDSKLIDGFGGPYVVDERGIRWESRFDERAEVTVEEQNEVRVVILARGWLKNPEAKTEPLCPFQTRIIAHRGSPMIRFQQHVVIGFDAHQHQLADVGFQFATGGPRFSTGVDGQTIAGDIPGKQHVFVHQDRYDRVRVAGQAAEVVEGKRSAGWFALHGAQNGTTAALLLRDVWQKFPKEMELAWTRMTLHLWPVNGRRAFDAAAELEERNIYKYWCFHQGRLLNLRLPQDYFDALKQMPGTNENTPEIAQAGNAMGAVIANEFALLLLPDAKAKELPGWARLFQEDPVASAPAEWNAGTEALGPMAAADRKDFPEIEDCVEKGYLSYTKSMERGNAYGMWNYADTHTYWNVQGDYAQLHRVWHNSHYHQVGKTWSLYYRSGSKALLDWARASTDHYINIGTVNYAPPDDPRDDLRRYLDAQPVIVDGKVQSSEQHWWLMRSPVAEQAPWYKYIHTILNVPPEEEPIRHFRFIIPGAMYHCKGLTHWGKKDYPMDKGEAHAWIWGHWMDPDASLWNWYIDANPRAWDVYQMWHGSVRKYGLPRGGVAREINTAIACAINLYEAMWDADLIPYIHGMANGLRTDEPLDQQQPGCMWHPQWINRYHHLTRDPEYVPFIKQYADNPSTATALALPALGYEVSGDKRYLFQHFDSLRDWPNAFFHKPGDPYDWYGQGPGPLGSGWRFMTWGEFLYQMKRAGLKSFDPVPPQPGNYPGASSRFDNLQANPSAQIYVWEEKDAAIDLRFGARSLGGDLHPTSIAVYAPSGKLLHHVPRVPEKGGPSSWEGKHQIAPDGETGMYRVEYRTFGALLGPVSNLPNEAALLEEKTQYWSWHIRGFLLPMDDSKPVQFTIRSESDRSPLNFVVRDAEGAVLAQGSLFQPRDLVSETLQLDPAKQPAPWLIEATGRMVIHCEGSKGGFLLGPGPKAVRSIRAKLARDPK